MADTLTIIKDFWPIAVAVVGGSAWYRFSYKKERRLFKNIQRPVGIIATKDKPMTHEALLLKRVGFFNISETSSDGQAVDLMNGKRLIIIGYSPNSARFKEAFNAARQREIPVIVYAGPTRITPEDVDLLQGYSHHSMCNTPLRLISDVFAVMATYPEDK